LLGFEVEIAEGFAEGADKRPEFVWYILESGGGRELPGFPSLLV